MREAISGDAPFLAALAGPALAQEVLPPTGICMAHPDLVRFLVKRYAMRPAGIGLVTNGIVLEVWVTDTGRWALVTTRPGQPSCLVSSGVDWHAFEREPI